MPDRWENLARLLALHGEACAALALLRARIGDGEGGVLRDVALGECSLARHLQRIASLSGAPRHLRSAARRHADQVARMLA
jgi:hypothetical protein